MIKQHDKFDVIPDETILWQYMSLPKFLSLIKDKKLHLHRIDDLMDKEEGVLSTLDKKSIPFYNDLDGIDKYMAQERQRIFVSCWINSSIEQSLMWYSYGKDGVAIRTTAAGIRRAMEVDNEHDIHMIGVHYIDKRKDAAHEYGETINMFRFSTTKRNLFEMENEVRLLFFDEKREYREVKGINVDVSIDELIEEIRVSSTLPDYVYNLICKEVNDAGLAIVPCRSEL